MIATDHAPHHYDAKEREFDDAPNGIIGLETAFGLAMAELVNTGLLSLPELMLRMSTTPARTSTCRAARWRPARRPMWWCWTRRCSGWCSRTPSTPRAGTPRSPARTLTGRADLTIVRGQVAFQRTS